jgi:hypothetical protein
MKDQWIPEIYYEETEDGITSHIPFIAVPPEEEMPRILFMFESRETEELEIGSDGEPLPIVNIDLHSYANMKTMKEKLDPKTYDAVRIALGLEALSEAVEKGKKITEKVRNNV